MDSITAQKIADLFDRAKREALALLREEETEQTILTLPDDEEGITAAEAAEMLSVKKWRVYKMVEQGILPAYRPSPRTLRLRRGAVREFIRTGKYTAKKRASGKVLPMPHAGVLQSAASNIKKGGIQP